MAPRAASHPARGRDLRLLALAAAAGAALLLLLVRLWQVQVLEGERYRARADVNRLRLVAVPAPRGVVYDRSGRQLVRNVPGYAARIVPADLPKDAVARAAVFIRLGALLGVPAEQVATRAEAGRRDPFTPVRVRSPITREQALVLEEHHTHVPGVLAGVTPLREYPFGALFGHLLGYTGPLPAPAAAQLVARGYAPDDHIGLTGIEAAFEDALRGTPGTVQVEVDAMGRVTAEVATLTPAEPGDSLVLTVDVSFQQRVADILAAAAARAGSRQAAAVALDPRNGDVLALVSLPQYDDNLFAAGISEEDYRQLGQDPSHPLVNHAIAGQYPPGSTFKLVTAAAALQERVVAPQTLLPCPGSLTVLGQTFRNWDPRGSVPVDVRAALATSCDVYFYVVAGGNPLTGFQGLGPRRLAEYARAFGLGQPSGIGLAGEAAGLVPDEDWKRTRLQEPWYLGDSYNTGIGQGALLATPLQLANVAAAVANGGTVYRPRLVSAVLGADGTLRQEVGPEVLRRLPVTPEHLAAIRAGMRDAVASPSGTAYATLSRGAGGVPDLAGKTGTAEFTGPRDVQGNLPTHALFVGFAPYAAPRIAVAVVVYGGGEGAAVAAPAAAEIVGAYLERTPG